MRATLHAVAEGRQELRIDYLPAPEVQAFVEDRAFVSGYFGPLGCGKTTSGVMKTWLYGQAYPGARVAVIRDTWPNLRDTTQKTFFEWFPDGVAGRYHSTRREFLLSTGPGQPPIEVIFRAMDDRKDISNMLSLDLAAAWIDEPQGGIAVRSNGALVREPGIDHDLFLALVGRLGRQPGYPGRLWMTGNPPAPSHWIAKEFRYPGHGRPPNPRRDYRLHLGRQATNLAHLPASYYERLMDLFGEGTPMARRFLLGEWIEFALLNPFHAEWIRTYDEAPKLSDMFVVVGVDPAISKKDEAAQTAMVVVGQPRRGIDRTSTFVLKAIAGHWSPYEQAEQLLELVKEFKPQRVRIEDVAWQAALADIVKREAALKGVRLPYIDLAKPQGDKLLRASAWSPLVEGATVLFGGPGHTQLVTAMLAVPLDASQWDLVDAAGLAIGGVPRQRAEQSSLKQTDEPEATRKRARSYAVRTTPESVGRPAPMARSVGPTPRWRAPRFAALAKRRARSYAVKM